MTTPFALLLQKMQAALLLHAVVINAKGNPIGIISESDLLTRTTANQHAAIRALFDDQDATTRQTESQAEIVAQRAELHRKDLPLEDLSVGELMTTPVITVQTHDTTQTAMRLLIENQLKRLPVVDDVGQVVGLLDRRTLLYGLLDHADAQ
jgi:CBS domain-containing protein